MNTAAASLKEFRSSTEPRAPAGLVFDEFQMSYVLGSFCAPAAGRLIRLHPPEKEKPDLSLQEARKVRAPGR